jgi:PleD family two-component response regulator
VSISASIGVATTTDITRTSPQELFDDADAAMYDAKMKTVPRLPA